MCIMKIVGLEVLPKVCCKPLCLVWHQNFISVEDGDSSQCDVDHPVPVDVESIGLAVVPALQSELHHRAGKSVFGDSSN